MDGRGPSGSGLHRAGRLAVRTERVAGNALIAALCAGTLAPVVLADAGLGAVSVAVSGLIASVGAGVATDLLTDVAQRLRGNEEESSAVGPDVVERALVEAVEKALSEGGAAGAAMRELAAAILRESGAVQSVLTGAASADPDSATALAVGLAGLGQQFGEFAAVSGQLREAALALVQEMALAAAERRETAARDQQLALLAADLRDALDAGAAGRGVAESTIWPQCPYPGLAPFRETDAPVFFGRRAMTRQLVQTVAERARTGGLLVLLGASGSGKSSLLRAGLVPALARDALGARSGAWPVRVISPTAKPVAELAVLCAALVGGDAREIEQRLLVAPESAVDCVAEALEPYRSQARGAAPVLVLAVDQFEELYTVAPPDQCALFLRALGALAAPRTDATGSPGAPTAVVLAALRGDYLDRAAADPAVAAAVAAGAFVVDAMTRAELREAIEGPAAEAGVPIESKLVATILDAALAGVGALGPGEQVLPLVSQALAETWRARRGKTLTLRAYYRAGGMADAADRSAQQVYQGLDGRGRTAARAMFMLLTSVSPDGKVARRTATREELHAAAALPSSEGDAVIDAFTARRLLVAEREGIAICHDVLLDAWRLLHEWLQGDATDRALYSEVIADAASWRQGRRDLYGRRRLAVTREAATRWAGDPVRYLELPPSAVQFLAASQRSARHAAWIRRAAVGCLIAVTGAAVGFAVDAQNNAYRAQAQHQIALSRQLAADSAAVDSSNPALAQQLAAAAWAVAATPEANQEMTTLLANDERTGTITLPGSPDALVYSPDGRTLAVLTNDGTVKLWDPATGQLRTLTTGITDGEPAVAFSPDGRTLAVGAGDGTVKLWDPATGRLRTTITDTINASDDDVSSVAFSPDGRTLAVGAGDGTVKLWDPATGRLRTSITDTTYTLAGGVYSVAFSPDGQMLAVGADDGTVKLWDPATGRLRTTITDTTDSPGGDVYSVAFSPDGQMLAVGAGDRMVKLWDPVTGRLRTTITDTPSDTSSMMFSPDGRTLAIGASDGTVKLLDPVTGHLRTTITDASAGGVLSVAFSPDGRTLAIGAGESSSPQGSLRLWDPTTGKLQTTATTIADTAVALTGSVVSVAFSPDGRTLAVLASDGTVKLWDPATGQLRTTITDEDTAIASSVAFSPDGSALAVLTSDGTVELWDPATGRLRTTINDNTEQAPVMAFSPDARTLAVVGVSGVGGSNGSDLVELWDPATGRLRTTITATTDALTDFVLSVAFSPDGRTLAVLTSDGTVKLWDPTTGQLRTTINAEDATTETSPGDASSMAFSPDGRTLAIGTGDGTVKLWDPATGHLRTTINDALAGGVWSVAFSPDGRSLAAVAGDGTVELWDPATGQLRTSFTDTTNGNDGVDAPSVAFSPDGNTLAAGASSGDVVLWALNIFSNSYQTLCASVGLPSSAVWRTFAPGEPEPSNCASS